MMNKDILTPLSLLFSPETMVQFKKMVNQFNDVFNDDFWENIARVNQFVKGRPGGSIPVEIWEDKQNFYIIVLLAGVKNKQNVKIRFKDERSLILKVKYPLLKPNEDCFMVSTEISGFEEREVDLPQPVVNNSYELDLNEGVLTLTLNKLNPTEK